MEYDYLVIGAGPSGLAAAIAAGQKGRSVLVIEKKGHISHSPRGESAVSCPVADRFLGPAWLETHTVSVHKSRLFHGPHSVGTFGVSIPSPSRFFHWETFMMRLQSQAEAVGVRFLFSAKVTQLLEENGVVKGVRYLAGQDEKEIRAGCVIGADGHRSLAGLHYGIDYYRLNCPMIKFKGKRPPLKGEDYSREEFYFLSSGELFAYPDLPPLILYYFPLDEETFEAGLMVRMLTADEEEWENLPGTRGLMHLWNELKRTYPHFMDHFTLAETLYEETTGLTNTRLIQKPLSRSGGAVLIGDASGFVNPLDSSGIIYGLAQADFWISLLEEKSRQPWSRAKVEELNELYRKWPLYLYLEKMYRKARQFELWVFRRMKNKKQLSLIWGPSGLLMQQMLKIRPPLG